MADMEKFYDDLIIINLYKSTFWQKLYEMTKFVLQSQSFDEKKYEKQQRCNVTWRSNFRKKTRETVLVKCFVSGLQWGDILNTRALFYSKKPFPMLAEEI